MKKKIAFQGAKGAYSDMVCHLLYPGYDSMPCLAFDDAFAAVREGQAELAMIPIENSVAGRVADVHHILPGSGLHIIAEHFQPIIHHLLGVKGAKLEDIKEARSHVQALAQCREWLRRHNIRPIICADTAGGAEEVAKLEDRSIAGVASELAGQIYGLASLATNISDLKNNVTRFVVLSKEANRPAPGTACITTLIFRVRSVPAALYKALGGFATNGVNITKLESYLVDGHFTKAQFRLDAVGHPDENSFQLALEELRFFAEDIKILGVYPAHKFRQEV
ncbi:MAG: prephenate dehydratase [Pseudomonadota bacterium]|nr:prephenate dehydratase [Pseudomonadota bacterium]